MGVFKVPAGLLGNRRSGVVEQVYGLSGLTVCTSGMYSFAWSTGLSILQHFPRRTFHPQLGIPSMC
jgi:hypothetical protein